MSEMRLYHTKNFPITSISHFDLISSSNGFAVMSSLIKSIFCFAFFSQNFCHLLSEMHERREKAYLATFNEDNMLVEDCDTTATAADAEVVASSLHEVRSDS